MNWLQLLRMARWVRNPPSAKRVKFGFAVVALCLTLFAIERWIGWPDWMSVDATRVPNRVVR